VTTASAFDKEEAVMPAKVLRGKLQMQDYNEEKRFGLVRGGVGGVLGHGDGDMR